MLLKITPTRLNLAKLQPLPSFTITAQQFYSHGDGTPPRYGNNSDKPGEYRGIHVVLHMVTVVQISHKNLFVERGKKERGRY